MKRATTTSVATLVGLFWVLTFKVTPHQAAPFAGHSTPSGQPVPSASAPAPSTATTNTPPPTPANHATDGNFTGSDVQTIYGDVQVRIVVSGGRVTDVKALKLPNDRARSAEISQYAGPALRLEVIQAQSANVDIISGATFTSQAYAESLSYAFQQAHLG